MTVEKCPFPRQAMLTLGDSAYRVRVLEYMGKGRFVVLDHQDARRVVHRSRLVFLPSQRVRERSKAHATSDDTATTPRARYRTSESSTQVQLTLW